MSSGLDELERRGRWGRAVSPQPPPSEPAKARASATMAKSAPATKRRPKSQPKSQPKPEAEGVERVVVYLSREQTAWIRERQIEALRAGKRVSASRLLRELMDRAMS